MNRRYRFVKDGRDVEVGRLDAEAACVRWSKAYVHAILLRFVWNAERAAGQVQSSYAGHSRAPISSLKQLKKLYRLVNDVPCPVIPQLGLVTESPGYANAHHASRGGGIHIDRGVSHVQHSLGKGAFRTLGAYDRARPIDRRPTQELRARSRYRLFVWVAGELVSFPNHQGLDSMERRTVLTALTATTLAAPAFLR